MVGTLFERSQAMTKVEEKAAEADRLHKELRRGELTAMLVRAKEAEELAKKKMEEAKTGQDRQAARADLEVAGSVVRMAAEALVALCKTAPAEVSFDGPFSKGGKEIRLEQLRLRSKLIELEAEVKITELQLQAANLAVDYQPELDRLAKRIKEVEGA